MKEHIYKCPECENEELLVREVETYYLNTGFFFCNSVKAHDSEAEVFCMECDWKGTRKDLENNKKVQ